MATRRNKIAFFDDDPDIVEAYKRNFEWDGFEFVSAANPPSALKAYREMLSDPPRFTVIDVIFKSFSSDKPNGFQLCRQLREIDPGGIFIVLTGMPDELTRIRLIDSKADCILEKPKTDVELLAVVKRIERERAEAIGLSAHRPLPSGRPLIIGFAILFGVLTLGLLGIGTYDWHCNVVLRERQDVANQANTDLVKSLFAQQQVNDKTRQDDKYAELERRLHDAESSLNGVWIDRGNMWRALDKAGIKPVPTKKDGR